MPSTVYVEVKSTLRDLRLLDSEFLQETPILELLFQNAYLGTHPSIGNASWGQEAAAGVNRYGRSRHHVDVSDGSNDELTLDLKGIRCDQQSFAPARLLTKPVTKKWVVVSLYY